jgi:hypothetical protein
MHSKQLQRQDIVGHRIRSVLGDSNIPGSSGESSTNFTSFMYVLDSGACFRLPGSPADGLERIVSTQASRPLRWPKWPSRAWWEHRKRLWHAEVQDILRPESDEEFFPDTLFILLSSGWCLWQMSSAPEGIAPCVGLALAAEKTRGEKYVSFWFTKAAQPNAPPL